MSGPNKDSCPRDALKKDWKEIFQSAKYFWLTATVTGSLICLCEPLFSHIIQRVYITFANRGKVRKM